MRKSRGLILFVGVISFVYSIANSKESVLKSESKKKEPQEKILKVELLFELGSDRENEDFFKPKSVAVGNDGRLYILDSGNSRIQCFSKEGNFLFSFGHRGQGPGELSNSATKIKILRDGKVYVIDNLQRRINIYDVEGNFISSAKTLVNYDDLVLIENTYYLSSIFLKEDYKTIHATKSLGEIDKTFGILIEPVAGILKELARLPDAERWRGIYSYTNFTSLTVNKNNEIIFSQDFPYCLIKYDREGNLLKRVSGDVDFDTHGYVRFTVDRELVSVSSPKPAARVLGVFCRDDLILVPYLNPDQSVFFLDIYDPDLNLKSRYRRPNLINDLRKSEKLGWVVIDDNGYLYAMIVSDREFPRMAKYKLIYE